MLFVGVKNETTLIDVEEDDEDWKNSREKKICN